jgi:DNA-binding helix-hairpin-helix protein with protein kinase domain
LKGAATGDKISFAGDGIKDNLLGGSIAASQVNVAAATTLAQALDIAANYTALTQQPGTAASVGKGQIDTNTGVIDWFQFNGNTYIVEANNNSNVAATHTALGAHDIVIEIVGLANLAGVFSGAGADTGVLTV